MRLKPQMVILAASLGGAACDASSPAQAPGGDAGLPDATSPDSAVPDAAVPDAAGADAAAPDAAPSCPVQFAYDPLEGTVLQTFPDDFYTRPDPATRTGLRLSMAAELAPWLPAIVGGYESVFRQLETLDGWGTTAGVTLRFTGPVASTELPTGALRLVSLAGEVATDVPFEIRTTDDDATLILWPMVPLAPATRHGVVVTRALRTPEGGCVDPSPTFGTLLDPAGTLDPRLTPLGPRYRALLDQTGTRAEDFIGGTVFTTQSIVEESAAIAVDVGTRRVGWTTPPACRDEPLFRVCDGVFTAADYRIDDVVAGTTPTQMYDLPVRAFLPPPTPEPPGPRPTVIFGHGLGSDRGQAAALAEVAAPLGFITVAIDAPAHGQHPTAEGDADILRIAGFFGINIVEQSLDGLKLRDHWRQATYDKLQLVRLLLDDGDLDGDAAADVDPPRLAYLGVSLGGIMGPELLALTPAIGLGVLSVPGGRVASIISDGPTFSVLVRAMTPPHTPPGDVARFFPVLQTLIERGDAANYAPHVLRDRLPSAGDRAPHLLFDMALDDAIVPNVCNRSLARALGIPHVPPVLQPVGIVPVLDGAPVRGNLDEGRTTAGLFQFDRVVERPGEPVVRAEHDNLAKSTEGLLQATHFLQTWVDTGLAEIIDPYAVLGTPPLP